MTPQTTSTQSGANSQLRPKEHYGNAIPAVESEIHSVFSDENLSPVSQEVTTQEEAPNDVEESEERHPIADSHLNSPEVEDPNPQEETSEENEGESSSTTKILRFWNASVERFWSLILISAVFILWPSGAIAFGHFQQKTDSTFHDPIPNSPSAAAQRAFDQAYPASFNNPMHPGLILVLQSKDNATDLRENDSARSFAMELGGYLKSTITPDTVVDWIQVLSYYSFRDQNLTILGDHFVASNGTLAILQLQYLLPDDESIISDMHGGGTIPANDTFVSSRPGDLLNALLQGIETYEIIRKNDDSSEITFDILKTGLKYFSSDLKTSTKQDLKRMDSFVLPVTLFLVGFVLPRANPLVVWIVPFVGILSTVACWSLLMNQLAKHIQITQFTPSIMMSLTLGMSIDYSMFLLARYFEVMADATKSRFQAIQEMLAGGGQVVILSGLTLMCTFLGLIVLPLEMLKSVGVGAAVAIGSCIASNLLFVPALLYSRLGNWIVRRQPEPTRATAQLQESEEYMTEPLLDNHLEEQRNVSIRIKTPPGSFWIRLSRQLLDKKKGPIIVLLTFVTIIFPVAINAARVKASGISFDLILPRDAPSMKAYKLLGSLGGPGRLSPFRLLFDGTRTSSIIVSEPGFTAMHQVVSELLKLEKPSNRREGLDHLTNFTSDMMPEPDVLASVVFQETDDRVKFSGVSVVNNKPISYASYKATKLCAENSYFLCPFENFRALDYVDKIVTSQNETATFLNVELQYSPFSKEGIEWLESARRVLRKLSEDRRFADYDLYLEGPSAIAHDAVTAVYQHFMLVVAMTLVVVFLLMGLFFKSLVPPLRSTVSILCTILFSFGAAALVYGDGCMAWTGIHSLAAIDGELCWLVPVMSFSIIVGLSLDYDVFLVSRILEYRCEGYMHFSSIAAGLDSTGGIITSAGLIMAFSFGSLLGSQSPALYQWSFLLTTGVLLDTFVVRTIIVPTLTGIAKKHCWYPRTFEGDRVRLAGFDDDDEPASEWQRE